MKAIEYFHLQKLVVQLHVTELTLKYGGSLGVSPQIYCGTVENQNEFPQIRYGNIKARCALSIFQEIQIHYGNVETWYSRQITTGSPR